MIETIRIGRLLRETVAAPYRNLVTSPTGAAVRSRIEEALARSTCHTAFLDFSDIELLDFSCADEVVAKLLMADTERGVRFLVLQGLREDQHEAIEHVLTHHRLVMIALPGDEQGVPRLLGWVSAPAPPKPSMATGIGVHEPGGCVQPKPQHGDGLGQLEKLKKLHDEGALSDAEFAAAKAKILSEL